VLNQILCVRVCVCVCVRVCVCVFVCSVNFGGFINQVPIFQPSMSLPQALAVLLVMAAAGSSYILKRRLLPHGTISKTIVMAQLTKLLCSERYRKFMWWISHFTRRKTLDIKVGDKNTKIGLAFVCADDPHSYVLLQCLKKLTAVHPLYVRVVVLPVGLKTWATDANNQIEWAVRDSAAFCKLYDILPPMRNVNKQTNEAFISVTAKLLLVCHAATKDNSSSISWDDISTERLTACIEVMGTVWGKSKTVTVGNEAVVLSSSQQRELEANDKLLRQVGYYGPGVVEVEGEIYLNSRLHHLERRLNNFSNDLTDAEKDSKLLFCKEMEALGRTTPFPYGLVIPSSRTPIKDPCAHVILYYSFRSPYSQLAIARLRKICAVHNAVFSVRCLMPMVMRGMIVHVVLCDLHRRILLIMYFCAGLSVPFAKAQFIMRDTSREARLWGINYGFACDPSTMHLRLFRIFCCRSHPIITILCSCC
jgi:hypothetical protein